MYMYLLQFDDEAAALADSVVGTWYNQPIGDPNGDPLDYTSGKWSPEDTFPNVAVTLSEVPQTGWWIIIATLGNLTSLNSHASCRVAWNSSNGTVVGGSYTSEQIAQLSVSPVPFSAVLPWPH